MGRGRGVVPFAVQSGTAVNAPVACAGFTGSVSSFARSPPDQAFEVSDKCLLLRRQGDRRQSDRQFERSGGFLTRGQTI